MKVKPNQTAIDVAFDLSGSLAGFPQLLYSLPSSERIGFDNMPELWEDVSNVDQTWTPDIVDLEVTEEIETYNDEAKKKAPFGTDLIGLQQAVDWGNAFLPTFLSGSITEFERLTEEVSDELKHEVKPNQTAIDVAFDLGGSITSFSELITQLPQGVRIGFDTAPELWEDVNDVGQTWTPDLQNKKYELDLTVYNNAATQKEPFGTDLLGLQNSIEWGNDFLEGAITEGEYMIDDTFNFMVDTNDNYITT